MTPQLRAQLESLRIGKEQRPSVASTPRPRRGWTLTFVVALLLAAALAAGYAARGPLAGAARRAVDSELPAAPVPIITVSAAADAGPQPLLTATGKIVSDHLVQVATKVSGQVVALHFEQGDYVEKGQVLARIEDVNYRARRDESKARLQKALASRDYQRVNFARVEALYKVGNAPEIEFADARRWRDDAEAQVQAEQASLDFFQKALADCEIAAPISGVILTREVEVGDFVAAEGGRGANANAQFASIADMTKLRVEVDISEMDIQRIHKDLPADVTPDAYKDRRFAGRVMWIDPGANYSKATVQVKVRIENPDRNLLRVEGSAKVVFFEPATAASADRSTAGAPAAASADAGIWIPAAACILDPRQDTGIVYRVSEGRLKKTAVTIGRRLPDRVQVLSGLADGQQIAADGLDRLRDGQRAM
jgi:RND family efflux transporter MFP subunit